MKSREVSSLVSVIIPTRNRPQTLARALASLQRQTHKALEVIVVDDASAETLHDVIAPFKKDLTIVYVRHDTNQGAARTRNAGLRLARGEYIALLDDDDEFFETKVERQVAAAQDCGAPCFVFCNGIGQNSTPAYDPERPSGRVTWNENVFPIRCGLPPPSSWLFHREGLRRAGYFDEAMDRWEDLEFCVRLMRELPVYVVNESLLQWHYSPNSVTGMSVKEIGSRIHFLDKHRQWMCRDRDYFYQFHWRLAKDLKEMGQVRDAARFFWRAFFINPRKMEALGLVFLSFVLPGKVSKPFGRRARR